MSKVYDMSGSLGINNNKKTDTHPDRTGKCVIEGREYWINGWVKETDGEPWLSLSFKPKEPKQPAAVLRPPPPDDDDIPF